VNGVGDREISGTEGSGATGVGNDKSSSREYGGGGKNYFVLGWGPDRRS